MSIRLCAIFAVAALLCACATTSTITTAGSGNGNGGDVDSHDITTATLERTLNGVHLQIDATAVPIVGMENSYGFELVVQASAEPGADPSRIGHGALFAYLYGITFDAPEFASQGCDAEEGGGCGGGSSRGGQGIGDNAPRVAEDAPSVTFADTFPELPGDPDSPYHATPGSTLHVEYVFGPFASEIEWQAIEQPMARHYAGESLDLCRVILHVSPSGSVQIALEPLEEIIPGPDDVESEMLDEIKEIEPQ